MRQIGVMMARVLRNPLDPEVRKQVRNEVLELCGRFPVYDDVDVV